VVGYVAVARRFLSQRASAAGRIRQVLLDSGYWKA